MKWQCKSYTLAINHKISMLQQTSQFKRASVGMLPWKKQQRKFKWQISRINSNSFIEASLNVIQKVRKYMMKIWHIKYTRTKIKIKISNSNLFANFSFRAHNNHVKLCLVILNIFNSRIERKRDVCPKDLAVNTHRPHKQGYFSVSFWVNLFCYQGKQECKRES